MADGRKLLAQLADARIEATRGDGARRESNSERLRRQGRAPLAAISGRSGRRTRRGGFSSKLLRPARSSRAVRACLWTSSCSAWGVWSGSCPRMSVGGAGVARPRRCDGDERNSLQNPSCTRGWWQDHRSERPVFELLVDQGAARRVVLRACPAPSPGCHIDVSSVAIVQHPVRHRTRSLVMKSPATMLLDRWQ